MYKSCKTDLTLVQTYGFLRLRNYVIVHQLHS